MLLCERLILPVAPDVLSRKHRPLWELDTLEHFLFLDGQSLSYTEERRGG